MQLGKFSFGVGDRFGLQGKAQLSAFAAAAEKGISITPVWNKSNREHKIVGTTPDAVRAEADAAVNALQWSEAYYVDADHIGFENVENFISSSNFFTIDVAGQVGEKPDEIALRAFIDRARTYCGELQIAGIKSPFRVNDDLLLRTAKQYLSACVEAGRIYRHLVDKKGQNNFVTEVSIDETNSPQTPVELFLILVMLAQQKVPAQTIAPKFSGRFNKGVDYVGDVSTFEQEFDADLYVLSYAIKTLGFPKSLKLSIHSGSDKFSIYPAIKRCIKKHDCGLHIKTAGTTWLEEVIGLAEAGGDGLVLAKEIYAGAFANYDDLTTPYATVIDIDRNKLPQPKVVNRWDSATYVHSLRHNPQHPLYNPHFRQLMHVGFKIAAKMGSRYSKVVTANSEIISKNVFENLLNRHMRAIFF
jgi:hypothetical protein